MIKSIKISSLARPMECAGSLHFKDLPKQPKNEGAEEGEAFGEYVERLLLKQDIGSHSRKGVPFDDDMKFHAGEIVKEVNTNSTDVVCEQQVDWETSSGIVLKGRLDASFVRNSSLYVDDFKYGWGLVSPENNWQLLGYAIGEVIRRNQSFANIVLRIHQPRPYHHEGPLREWRLTYSQLLDYKETIENRMHEIAEGEDELATGAHCKYCPAAAFCPAFNKSYFRSVEEMHSFLQDDISDEELSFQLDLYDRMQQVFKIRKDSLEQLAIDRLNNNRLVPNYTTVRSYGNRKWTSEATPEFIEMMTGKDVTKVEMLSPAQAEKKGVPKDITDKLTSRYFKGLKLERRDMNEVADQIFGDPNG